MNSFRRLGVYAAGFALMLDAARKTSDAQLYQRATDIALQSRSGDAALAAARAWQETVPDARDARRFELQLGWREYLVGLVERVDTAGADELQRLRPRLEEIQRRCE